ncbi:MAG: ribonuclease M5 [Pseudomonadota bacterium]
MVKIRDIIVVEGRDDARAVKQSVDAEVIITRGFGLTEETFSRIAAAHRLTGVIVFTDPDHAGEQIRRRINDRIQGCKNAFLTRERARRDGNIGIEHAGPEDIVAALMDARCAVDHSSGRFTQQMLLACGLVGAGGAARKRNALGSILGIGYANGRQFLNRLNRYGISQCRFHEAMAAITGNPGEHRDAAEYSGA